jgi:hypothetical protein
MSMHKRRDMPTQVRLALATCRVLYWLKLMSLLRFCSAHKQSIIACIGMLHINYCIQCTRRGLPVYDLACGRLLVLQLTSGGGGGSTSHKLQPAQLAQLNELRSSLLQFEDKLPWNCVTRAFASSRGAWRKELAHASSLRQFVRCYKDFLQVRCNDAVSLRCIRCAAIATLCLAVFKGHS